MAIVNKMSVIRKICKYISGAMIAVIVCALMIELSYVEANANQPKFQLTQEQLNQAALRAQELTDIIMSGDEFLFDGEIASDYEGIHSYLDNEGRSSYSYEALFSDESQIENSLDGEDADYECKEELIEVEEVIEDDKEQEDTKSLPDKNDWRLILVNKQNPVPEGYEAKLGNINGSQMADERILDDIKLMLDAAQNDNVNLMICSAYRSYDRQVTLFNNKMSKLMNKGLSYMEAYTVGSMSVTVPGTSEHQLGLALDILTSDYIEMDDGFGETEAGIWLKENAPEYGFILRYPKGKEDITGIIYEPWHFRYVGTDYSKEITSLGVTLEEYLNGEY